MAKRDRIHMLTGNLQDRLYTVVISSLYCFCFFSFFFFFLQLTDTACVLDYKELSNLTPSALMGFNFVVKML